MGTILVAGGVVCVVSLGLSMVFLMAGVFRGTYTRTPVTNEITDVGPIQWIPATLGLAAIGFLAFGAAAIYGVVRERRIDAGTQRILGECFVVARFAMNRDQNLIQEADFEFHDDLRYYIKLRLPDGSFDEFQCAPEVYFAAGEGMRGEAEIKGRWLGRFSGYIGRV